MAEGSAISEAAISPPPRRMAWRGRVFGLDVVAPWPLAGVPVAPDQAGTRSVQLSLSDPGESARDWPEGATLVFNQLLPDGRTLLTLEQHDGLGYRVLAPGFGTAVVSSDAERVAFAAPSETPRWLWERFVVAQILPFAAVLQGLEVFHASGVILGGRLVAFSAGCGTGKTSLALELVRRGARLFNDDVLTLDPACPDATCFPGAGAVNLRDPQLKALAEAGAPPFGGVLGRAGRTFRVLVDAHRGSRPLDRFYLLTRESGLDEPVLRRVGTSDELLASTFNFAVRSPDRLRRQLDACAHIAGTGQVFELAVPEDFGVVRTAAFVEQHVAAG